MQRIRLEAIAPAMCTKCDPFAKFPNPSFRERHSLSVDTPSRLNCSHAFVFEQELEFPCFVLLLLYDVRQLDFRVQCDVGERGERPWASIKIIAQAGG